LLFVIAVLVNLLARFLINRTARGLAGGQRA